MVKVPGLSGALRRCAWGTHRSWMFMDVGVVAENRQGIAKVRASVCLGCRLLICDLLRDSLQINASIRPPFGSEFVAFRAVCRPL